MLFRLLSLALSPFLLSVPKSISKRISRKDTETINSCVVPLECGHNAPNLKNYELWKIKNLSEKLKTRTKAFTTFLILSLLLLSLWRVFLLFYNPLILCKLIFAGGSVNPLNFRVMNTYSVNNKFEKTCKEIANDLLSIHGNEDEARAEIKHYKESFPKEPDYNLAQYGNLIVYYSDLREMFIRCGYSAKELKKVSDFRLWKIYLYRVGYVVRKGF